MQEIWKMTKKLYGGHNYNEKMDKLSEETAF